MASLHEQLRNCHFRSATVQSICTRQPHRDKHPEVCAEKKTYPSTKGRWALWVHALKGTAKPGAYTGCSEDDPLACLLKPGATKAALLEAALGPIHRGQGAHNLEVHGQLSSGCKDPKSWYSRACLNRWSMQLPRKHQNKPYLSLNLGTKAGPGPESLHVRPKSVDVETLLVVPGHRGGRFSTVERSSEYLGHLQGFGAFG